MSWGVSAKAARGVVPENMKPMGIWSSLGKAQKRKSKTKPKESTLKYICGFYQDTFLSLLERQLFQELFQVVSGPGIHKQLRQFLGLGSMLFVPNHEA